MSTSDSFTCMTTYIFFPSDWNCIGSKGAIICRGAVKLFADFYQSDIIVASPLGLVTKKAEGEEDAVQDLDFLSSIDIVLAARCDVFQMQNWAHVAAGKLKQCISLLTLYHKILLHLLRSFEDCRWDHCDPKDLFLSSKIGMLRYVKIQIF